MGAKVFTDEYLKTRSATFGELTKNLLAQDAKSAYKQAAIIMLRNAFLDLELCGGEKELDTESNCSIPVISNWVAYDFDKIETRPPKYGKYFIFRKDGKMHWETWNGSGWAYNNTVIRYWAEIKPPCY